MLDCLIGYLVVLGVMRVYYGGTIRRQLVKLNLYIESVITQENGSRRPAQRPSTYG